MKVGKPVFYVNRTIGEMLRIQAMNKSTNALALADGVEQLIPNFLGIPVRLCDQLLATEANVA